VPAALVQELIDVAVILNALRALRPARERQLQTLAVAMGVKLHTDHLALGGSLDRLRGIADALDDANPAIASALVAEANAIRRRWSCTSATTKEKSIRRSPASCTMVTVSRP
jgi:hypothetical protein